MSTPVWVPESAILVIQAELLAEHGGSSGTVNPELLKASLARPQQLFAYGDPVPSLHQLAAAYGFAFAKNHCFTDGNKRVALVTIDVFLRLNGERLIAPEAEAADAIIRLAAGELSEVELVAWITRNTAVVEAE